MNHRILFLAAGLTGCAALPTDLREPLDPQPLADEAPGAEPSPADDARDEPLGDPSELLAAYDLLWPNTSTPGWATSDAWYDTACPGGGIFSHGGVYNRWYTAGTGCKTQNEVAWQGDWSHGNNWTAGTGSVSWTDFVMSYDAGPGGWIFVADGGYSEVNLNVPDFLSPPLIESSLDAGITRIPLGTAEGMSPELGYAPNPHPPAPWSFGGPYGSWVFDLDRLAEAGALEQVDGTILVVSDERFAQTGLLTVELDVAASPTCAREMDGTFTVSGLVDGELVFDGSVACDNCADAFVDGLPAGSVCF